MARAELLKQNPRSVAISANVSYNPVMGKFVTKRTYGLAAAAGAAPAVIPAGAFGRRLGLAPGQDRR